MAQPAVQRTDDVHYHGAFRNLELNAVFCFFVSVVLFMRTVKQFALMGKEQTWQMAFIFHNLVWEVSVLF